LLWFEESFWASELLVTNSHDLSIWKFVLDIMFRGVFEFLEFFLIVSSNVAMFFFESSSNIFFSTGNEVVTSFSEDSTEIISKLSTSEIISLDTVR